MSEHTKPTVYVIAGPNGAGKTTFAKTYLPRFVDCREFVNADLIAAGLSPFDPESQAYSVLVNDEVSYNQLRQSRPVIVVWRNGKVVHLDPWTQEPRTKVDVPKNETTDS